MRNNARLTLAASVSVMALWLACGGQNAPSNPAGPSSPGSSLTPAPEPFLPTVVLTGAGDLANCETPETGEKVAKLLDGIEGLLFTAGDNVYENGNAGGVPEVLRRRHGDGISHERGLRQAIMTTTRAARLDISNISAIWPGHPASATTATNMAPGRSCLSTACARPTRDRHSSTGRTGTEKQPPRNARWRTGIIRSSVRAMTAICRT